MKITGTIPIAAVEAEYETKDRAEAVKRFQAEHPGVRPETIDGDVIRGICRQCGRPIMKNDAGYGYRPQGGYACPACHQNLQNIQNTSPKGDSQP